MTIVEPEHFWRQPGRNMHTIRDVSDWNLVFRLALIKASPHGAGNLAVQSRDSIGTPRESKSQHCHAEKFVGIRGLLAPETKQAFLRKPQGLPQGADVLFHKAGFKAVMSS